MKRIFLTAALGAILISGISVVTSCNEEKHASEICLPDSTLVGKSLPTIDGTLAEYYSIVPQPYVLNLSDSILSLKVKLRHEKTYVPNKIVTVTIGNPDSLGSKFPYIELVDSTGAGIKKFRLQVDTLMVKQLDALITGEPGVETELTFISPNTLTVEQKDSLALVAKNFNVVANLISNVDSETIDQMLKSYKSVIYGLNNFVSGFAGIPPTSMGAHTIGRIISREKAQEANLKSVEPYMSAEQKAEYNKIKASRTKSPWAR